MVICLERGADLHTAQLMPLPLTVSCFSEIQIGFTFLVPADPGSPGQRAVERVCVCPCDGQVRYASLTEALHLLGCFDTVADVQLLSANAAQSTPSALADVKSPPEHSTFGRLFHHLAASVAASVLT